MLVLVRNMNCLDCGADAPPTASFCAHCGRALRPAGTPAQAKAHHERRQLTILFCDLVGSTGLSNALDAEDLQTLILRYQQACSEVVQRLDGSIAQYLGDGLLVYFGFPNAYEDNPTRALRCALGMLDAMTCLNDSLGLQGEQRLRVRIGIHSGVVVIGAMGGQGRQERLAIGEAPNIAARLQGLAEPDCIVISAATLKLIAGDYAKVDLGEVALKGIERPVHAYAMHRQAQPSERQLDPIGPAPMFGRESELARLRAAWQQARAGTGTVVAIRGEPGMGKSLLLRHLLADIADSGGSSHTLRCSPYHSNASFQPLLDWLEQRLGITLEDSAAERFAKLQAGWPGPPHADDLCLMAGLLSIPLPAGHVAPNLTPVVAKQRTDARVMTWLRGGSALTATGSAAPVAVICEDLHWADPGTLAFLLDFCNQIERQPVLLVLTFRTEFSHPGFSELPLLLAINLKRLPSQQSQAIIDRLTGGKTLPPLIVQTILERTDGVPIYLQEYTRTVLESGQLIEHADRYELQGDLPVGLIPSSLRDSLTARLDRLGPARRVAQHAAVIGRRFGLDLLGAILPEGPDVATQGLVRLTESGLVYADPDSRDECEFMHALMQLAAYESMLKRDRHEIHALVANRIDGVFPDLAERQPALVARHLTEAQQWGPAAARWLHAGGRSLTRSANLEAVAQLREGLALLVHLPPAQAAPLELALLSTIGPALIATTGFGSPEVGQTYARTRELCETLGDRPEAFPSLWGSWIYYHIRGELRTGQGYARRMLAMAQATDSDAMWVEAFWTQGNSHYWLGELQEADRCLAATSAMYNADRHAANRFLYGQDPGVAAECYRAYSLWQLGLPDQSLAAVERARALAARDDHAFSVAWVLTFEFGVYMYRREPAPLLAAADRCLAFCIEQGTPFWIALAQIVRGWARVMQGEFEAGITEMRAALALYDMIGSLVVQPFLHALLAEALMHAGHHDEARAAIETGLAQATRQQEKISEIDLWIAQGDLDQRQHPGRPELAETAYLKAAALATSCGARSLALRTATRLHPLLITGGRVAESALPALFANFCEGHDCRDWLAAKAALDLQTEPEQATLCAVAR